MVVSERLSEQTYLQIAWRAPDGQWELHHGRLREKPGMSVEHNDVMIVLATMLVNQLDRNTFRVRANSGRLRRAADRYYIPDVAVIPADLERARRGRPGTLEIYAEPLPLVVEVWSPSTGDYDVGEKLDEYRQRGDLEIWRIHPFERTLTAWRRQPDGAYEETTYRAGTVRPISLPGVAIDLAAPFDA